MGDIRKGEERGNDMREHVKGRSALGAPANQGTCWNRCRGGRAGARSCPLCRAVGICSRFRAQAIARGSVVHAVSRAVAPHCQPTIACGISQADHVPHLLPDPQRCKHFEIGGDKKKGN